MFHDDTGLAALDDAIVNLALDIVSILFEVVFLLEQYRPDRGQKNFNTRCWKTLCALGILYYQGVFIYTLYSIILVIMDAVMYHDYSQFTSLRQ